MITLQRRGIVDEYRKFSFSRASTAFDSRGRLYYPHNARFETVGGRTGVLVEEGTTNLVANGNGELGDTWWLVGSDNRFYWNADLLAFENKPNAPVYSYRTKSPNLPVTPGKSYTYSLYMKGNAWAMYVRFFDANNMQLSEQRLDLYPFDNQQNDYFRLFSLTAIAPENASYAVLYFDTFQRYNLLRYIQFEEKPYTTSYINGTRAAETLTVPTAGVLDQNNFDICGWFVPTTPAPTHWARIWVLKDVPLTGLYYEGGAVKFAWNNKVVVNTGVGLNPYDVLFYSVSKTGNNVTVRVAKNGGQLSTFTSTTDGSVLDANEISFGSSGSGSYYHFSGIHGPVRISNIARSDEEIVATYASGQPLQADQYTTLLLNFDGPDAQQAAKTIYI